MGNDWMPSKRFAIYALAMMPVFIVGAVACLVWDSLNSGWAFANDMLDKQYGIKSKVKSDA